MHVCVSCWFCLSAKPTGIHLPFMEGRHVRCWVSVCQGHGVHHSEGMSVSRGDSPRGHGEAGGAFAETCPAAPCLENAFCCWFDQNGQRTKNNPHKLSQVHTINGKLQKSLKGFAKSNSPINQTRSRHCLLKSLLRTLRINPMSNAACGPALPTSAPLLLSCAPARPFSDTSGPLHVLFTLLRFPFPGSLPSTFSSIRALTTYPDILPPNLL